jgi:hypothetical protein
MLLVPAVKGLWQGRSAPLQRFLFCWLAGYLLYLELISSKPALYTVEALFPAAAVAAALALDKDGSLALPPYMLRPPAWLVALLMAGVFAGILYFRPSGTIGIVLGALLVTALFALAAQAAREKLAALWLALSVVGFALFLAFTFAVVLPSLKRGWPATRIAEAIAPLEHCVVGPVEVLGYREPSALFVLGRESESSVGSVADQIAGGDDGIAVVEQRWHGDLVKALQDRHAEIPTPAGCVQAFNVMRGCPLAFSIYITGAPRLDPECKISPRYACNALAQTPAGDAARCR